jgi:UDP-galactopyranose mutase
MANLLYLLFGLLTGILAYLIAPWVGWGIEKRRDKRNARRDLVLNTREYIGSKSFSAFNFHQETYFIRLKPHLEEKVIDWVENFEKYYDAVEDPSNLVEDLKVELLKQLQRIEKKWGLI